MKGYKGFSKGLICRGKQYAENTVFEEDDAEICKKGMHFCQNPFDVLNHYGFVDENTAELNEFCEVEALDDVQTDDQKKYCTKKLKVGAKIGISGLINAFVSFTLANIKSDDLISDSGNRSAATNMGDYSAAMNTGNRSAATNTGYKSAATNTGYRSAATNTGNRSAATNMGDYSAAMNTGNRSAATNTGDYSAATNTGDYSAAMNTGYCSAATNTGDRSAATNTGNRSAATNTGNRSAATNTGDRSAAMNTGYRSAATVTGSESFAIATGVGSKAKGALGCYIALAEWKWNDSESCYQLVDFKTHKVDGETIKPDTFYTLKNGEFVEVDS